MDWRAWSPDKSPIGAARNGRYSWGMAYVTDNKALAEVAKTPSIFYPTAVAIERRAEVVGLCDCNGFSQNTADNLFSSDFCSKINDAIVTLQGTFEVNVTTISRVRGRIEVGCQSTEANSKRMRSRNGDPATEAGIWPIPLY